MVYDPSLILYACIAKETIVLAEFNSKDHPDLGSIALQCLANTPSLHTIFSHTIRGKTYMFLIQEPFTYFVIYDEKLENPDGLSFLESIKEAFGNFANNGWSKKKLDRLGSHCFQGEFNPVFHQLLTVSGEFRQTNVRRVGMILGPDERNSSMDSTSGRKRIGKVPLLEGHEWTTMKKKKKKKRPFFKDLCGIGKVKDGGERKIDVCDDDDSSLDFSTSPMDNNNHNISINQSGVIGSIDPVMFQRHAKKSWRKHVWIVLSLDFTICLILFIIWLWVCKGFTCIYG
ncbi:hypothetical protein LIER_24958 [Lithospermum erythrorhizon]|uniref:Longin domain-containing protein n=1 Tax=Lithospermum erythrorhizon TaxID=34254 RepID=A0AAV3R476_LITER